VTWAGPRRGPRALAPPSRVCPARADRNHRGTPRVGLVWLLIAPHPKTF
jgi:hypothetical protein